MNEMGHNVITLENIDVCCATWYIIHSMSKMEFIYK